MKIAIMQPYFLPYIGYFSLIKHTDKFILFDIVQFIRHGWIERNRVLKQQEGWQYISVPLKKHSRDILISDIKIDNDINWKEKIFAQLTHYKKRAPYYKQTVDVLNNAFNICTDSIVLLNFHILKTICEYINIEFNCRIYSDMDLKIGEVNSPDEWALQICKAMGNVNEYINPEGGLEFFNINKYNSAGIDIKFLKHNLSYYSQRRGAENFEGGLSITDVMMFNPPEVIKSMLDDITYINSQNPPPVRIFKVINLKSNYIGKAA